LQIQGKNCLIVRSMPIIILTYVVQIGLIIHVLKTGRPPYWCIILLIAPGIGGLAYFIMELLPSLQNDMRARRALRGVKKTLNPHGDLRRRQMEHRLSGSVDAARHLAAELMEKERYTEAIEHYRTALTGIYEHDPDLMLGLATAQFGDNDAAGCKATLDTLKETNPEYRSPNGHLLYAKALEELGELQQAEEEYAALAGYFPGVEARIRYAQLLERIDKAELAREEYVSILSSAELAPRHFRSAQRKWLSEAKRGVARLH
jgi:hypothetical protein